MNFAKYSGQLVSVRVSAVPKISEQNLLDIIGQVFTGKETLKINYTAEQYIGIVDDSSSDSLFLNPGMSPQACAALIAKQPEVQEVTRSLKYQHGSGSSDLQRVLMKLDMRNVIGTSRLFYEIFDPKSRIASISNEGTNLSDYFYLVNSIGRSR